MLVFFRGYGCQSPELDDVQNRRRTCTVKHIKNIDGRANAATSKFSIKSDQYLFDLVLASLLSYHH